MSSVPVQFLIYVQGPPSCSNAPFIVPLNGCLEVTAGVSISFNVTVINNCDPNVSDLGDLIVVSGISGMENDVLTDSVANVSVAYMTVTWTPDPSQIGSQQLCLVAFTE
jgi:hypothetical protein